MDQDVRLLIGQPLAERVLADVKRRAEILRGHGIVPQLALVSVGRDEASRVYLARKRAEGERAGFHVRALAFEATASPQAVRTALEELAGDPAVHGMLLQMPLPPDWRTHDLELLIPPSKDVDGFHPENLGRLAQGLPGFVACTPLGILGLLRHYEIPLAGRRVTVVGRSRIVGTPMALLLAQKGVDATVTIAHSKTPDLETVCREADVLVVAMGVPEAIGPAHVKPGAAVIDVGIHRLARADDPSKTRLVGDVRAELVKKVAGALSPVPGGVGPLTVAYLLRNTVEAAEHAARNRGVLETRVTGTAGTAGTAGPP